MIRGQKKGTIRFGLVTACKPIAPGAASAGGATAAVPRAPPPRAATSLAAAAAEAKAAAAAARAAAPPPPPAAPPPPPTASVASRLARIGAKQARVREVEMPPPAGFEWGGTY